MSPLQWLLVALAAIAVMLLVRWFVSPPKGGFNQAVAEYRKLKYLRVSEDQSKYIKASFHVIDLCQKRIARAPGDGDSHVLLASTYFGIATSLTNGNVSQEALLLGAAVIKWWQLHPMHTRNGTQGQQVLSLYVEHCQQLQTFSWSADDTSRKALDMLTHGAHAEVIYPRAISNATCAELLRSAT